jgi:hypothetical protein
MLVSPAVAAALRARAIDHHSTDAASDVADDVASRFASRAQRMHNARCLTD